MSARIGAFLGALLLLAVGIAPAHAANVHLKGGAKAEPAFIDAGLSLSASGALAGLGNGDVLVTLSATADVASTCTNQGGNQAPGQNPAEVSVSGSQSIPETEIKNGNTPFAVETAVPSIPWIVSGAPGCPNPNWTQEVTDLAFTSVSITIEQPAGTVVLTVSCTLGGPTYNGAVSKQAVSCTSS
jgi:hypothetical protein